MSDSITHFHLFRCFYPRNDITYISCRQFGLRHHIQLQHTYFIGMIFFSGCNKFHEIIFANATINDFEICYDTTEWIKYRVKNQCLQWSIGVTLGSRHSLDDCLQYIGNTDSSFPTCTNNLLTLASEQIYNLIFNLFGLCTIKVNLIYYRYYFQVVVNCHVKVRDSLSLNTLRCVNNQ